MHIKRMDRKKEKEKNHASSKEAPHIN